MGITAENLGWAWPFIPGPPAVMIELGNQHMHLAGLPPVAKRYFEKLGFCHISLDLNGEDGAVSWDLAKPFDLKCQADVVTDFGTSEHVWDLYACLENMHRHLRRGGRIIAANPEPGSWPGHGYWYRTQEFYRELARLAAYEVIDLNRAPACGNTTDGWETRVVLEKRMERPFPERADFERLPGLETK